jgi:hypothetical protein
MTALSIALVSCAILAWDAFRRFVQKESGNALEVKKLVRGCSAATDRLAGRVLEVEGASQKTTELVATFDDRVKYLERWVNLEETRRGLGKARAR